MKSTPQATFAGAALLASALFTPAARAIIVYVPGATGSDPPTATRLTTSPVGDQGWSLQGEWTSVGSGTPIASNYFLTAKHLTFGNIPAGATDPNNQPTFTLNGNTYHVTNVNYDPNSDLAIMQVSETFSSYAHLYLSNNIVSKPVTLFGRGGAPGAAVTVGGNVQGWLWPTDGSSTGFTTDGVHSWGANVVAGIAHDNTLGDFLAMPFNSVGPGKLGVANEGGLSAFDSGGGVFVQDPSNPSQYDLAGINYGIDSPFSTSSTGSNPFYATIFNETGLFENDGTGTYVPATGPATSFSSDIAADAAWIGSIVPSAVPEPSSVALLVGAAALACRRRRA